MQKKKIKYVDEMVCFQEVPDETTLSFSISNCPHRCDGCHSKYLWEDAGTYVEDILEEELKKYSGLITCVLFMGGDDSLQVESLIKCVNICKEHGLKTALYSGAYDVSDTLYKKFDYIKIGPYVKSLGGLDHTTTNQKMLKKLTDGSFEDITHRFLKKKKLYDSSF